MRYIFIILASSIVGCTPFEREIAEEVIHEAVVLEHYLEEEPAEEQIPAVETECHSACDK